MVKLESVTDILLAQHGLLGKEFGCYTDRHLDRQRRWRGECSYDDDVGSFVRPRALEGIKWPSMRMCLRRGKCPDRALECLRLRLSDYTYREIADMPKINVHYSTVSRDIHLAVNILMRDGTLGMIEMLCEVFNLSPATVTTLIAKN